MPGAAHSCEDVAILRAGPRTANLPSWRRFRPLVVEATRSIRDISGTFAGRLSSSPKSAIADRHAGCQHSGGHRSPPTLACRSRPLITMPATVGCRMGPCWIAVVEQLGRFATTAGFSKMASPPPSRETLLMMVPNLTAPLLLLLAGASARQLLRTGPSLTFPAFLQAAAETIVG